MDDVEFLGWVEQGVADGSLKPPGGPAGFRAFQLFLTGARARFEEEKEAAFEAAIAAREAERDAAIAAVRGE